MRYFFSTGEASGELNAVALAQAICALDPDARFEGIGGARMRAAGFDLWRDNAGWASLGPVAAIPRIPKLLLACAQTAAHVAREKPDLVVLVDFGAFNVRLAALLRKRYAYAGPIVDWFPPGAWLDDERRARAVAALAVPVTAFEHQRSFYDNLGLPVQYFGHPMTARYEPRAPRVAPPDDGGAIAILPGSRTSELKYHAPRLRAALELLRARRPNARAIASASDEKSERALRKAFAGAAGVTIVRGLHAAIDDADAAWVAGGTALLEVVLAGVPAVALYVIPSYLEGYAKRIYNGRFYTLPNLIAGREVVPELIQDRATPQALADAMDALLRDPAAQRAGLSDVRAALGPTDALERCAAFSVRLARGAA